MGATIIFDRQRLVMMRQVVKGTRGQNMIEYAIIIALVSAAMIAMSTYVYRSVQATQKMVEDEFRNE
jgi:Flp pilus assembly pilin Flp